MIAFPAVAAPAPHGNQSPPPGDPDQIRTTRASFAAAATAMSSLAPQIQACGMVEGWVGATAEAYRHRMGVIGQRIGRGGQAMHDAAAAFGDLAARLEDAHLLWAQASALAHPLACPGAGASLDDLRYAARLSLAAHEEAGQAARIARDRMAAVTSTLHALRAQAKAPLPQSPINSTAINPCGVFPHEASSAFWDNGIIPLDTVCIVYTDVIVEVDGEPVSVLEAVPFVGPGDTSDAKGRPKSRNRIDPQNQEAIPPDVKALVTARIRRDLAVGSEGLQLQAATAQNAREAGVRVIGYGNKIVNKYGRDITDIDFETEQAIVEVTVTADGKLDQLKTLRNDRRVNPEGKAVALYGPHYTPGAAHAIDKEFKGAVKVFTDRERLVTWLLEAQR